MIKHFCDHCGKEITGPYCENVRILQRYANTGITTDRGLVGEFHISCLEQAINKELSK